jgi:hypothetical protein
MKLFNVKSCAASWKTPRFKAFQPEGVTLGANVTWAGVSGQVWSQAKGSGMWWVVTDDQHAEAVHESAMAVTGQCVEEMFELAA